MYVTKEFDFRSAIQQGFKESIEIINALALTANQYLVTTTAGKFMCESFESNEGEVWMKIWEVK